MQQSARLLLIQLAITALLSSSCTGSTRTPAHLQPETAGSSGSATAAMVPADEPAAAVAGFAALPELLALPRDVSFTLPDGYRDGADFSTALPNQRVSTVGISAEFAPDWPLTGASGDKTSFAIYDFSLPDYADTPVSADFIWTTQPSSGMAYLALANFDTQRWDWQALPGSQSLAWQEFAPYIDGNDRCLLALLVIGTDTVTLDSLHISTAQAPLASFTVNPAHGFAPLSVILDAQASSDPDGIIETYEWDLDGDGEFNEDGAEADALGLAIAANIYLDAGDFQPSLRVTDDDGFTDSASVSLDIRPQWLHTIGKDREEKYQAIALDQSNNIFAAGYTVDEVMGTINLLLTKWNRDGEFQWGRTWRLPGGYKVCLDMATDETGAPVLCGWFQGTLPGNMDYDGIVMKWTPDGELAWSRVYAGSGNDLFNSLCVDGTDIYIAGVTSSLGSNDDALVLRMDGQGSFIWAQRYYWFEDYLTDSALLLTPEGAVAFYAVGYQYNSSTNKVYPFYLRYGLDGSFQSDGTSLSSGGELQSMSLAVDYDADAPAGQQARLYIAMKNSGEDLVLSGLYENQTSLFAQSWSPNSAADTWPFALLLDPAGNLIIAGSSADSAALWRASSETGVISAAQGWTVSGQKSSFAALALLDNGILTAGWSIDNSGEWGPLDATQMPTSLSWSGAAGLVTAVNISLEDPVGIYDVDTWPDPEIDMDTGELDGLLSLYVLP